MHGQHYVPLKLILCDFVGALYRYWESHKRTVNDSRPDRAEAVEQNKKKLKRKSHQRGVCILIFILGQSQSKKKV